MKKGQVFCRVGIVRSERTYWVNADILDLTQESFNVFIAGILFRAGALTGIVDDAVEGDHIPLHIKPELEEQYIKEKLNEE